MNKCMVVIAGMLGLLVLVGCERYYQVTDPTTGREYYTMKLDTKGSAYRFTDERTNALVTLQNSEIKPITAEQYEAGKNAPVKPAAR